MWYVYDNYISKWLKCRHILCYHPADNNSPIPDKVFHDILIWQQFYKLNVADWFLATMAVEDLELDLALQTDVSSEWSG